MKIVVRGANWIGDGVMTVPALRELRRLFPDASITLHTRTWAKGVFQNADFLDEVISFDRETGVRNLRGQAALLREKKFDLGIVFPNSFASALAMRLGGVDRRFGYAKEGRGFLLSDPVEIPTWKNERHEVYYYLNLISQVETAILGTDTTARSQLNGSLNVSPQRKAAARQILSDAGVKHGQKVVALGVGSTNSMAKRWGAERYARLNDALQTQTGAAVMLVGGPDEIDVSKEVVERSKHEPLVLTGKTNLSEATAILSIVDLLVSNDMGLAHIAPATGTKTIVIFGPTDPATTRPFSENG
ncbi:MAG TPA: lipopolysaccharide heptosyltransferase II, partial [Pyrinomonadaceae bacterium]|nr:lipopolysaccharide heptosyltransferase II [Pyrinomonadaceae bacterium]